MKIHSFFNENKYWLLFLSLLLFIVLPGFFHQPFVRNLISATLITVVIITSLQTLFSGKRFLLIWLAVLIPLITARWLTFFVENDEYIVMVFTALLFVFMCWIIYKLVKKIVNQKTIHLDIILIAVSIYLLMGIVFGFITALIHIFYDGAYAFPEGVDQHSNIFIYYSFVTMMTLGYGDIIPTIPESQTIAVLIGLAGQLYIAVTIAILVGKFSAKTGK